ncbi:MAG: FHA domain-containing protein [Gammaproteobacteria bacterium]|nr:FHA domain-containing protein [Gammaproteobacteria bacterium]
MSGSVTLDVIRGKLKGKSIAFDKRTVCVIGRALDCNVILPSDDAHITISRYHCLLDINPPSVRVRDFGSRNGTFVNGVNIGQRRTKPRPPTIGESLFPQHDLRDGDELALGDTVFRISTSAAGVEDAAAQEAEESTRGAAAEAVRDEPDPVEAGVIGDYDLLEQLGDGAVGKVFLAQRRSSGEQVALKILRPRVPVEAWARKVFLREVKSAEILSHRNILAVRDSGFAGERHPLFYFTFEYCPLGNVVDRLRRAGGRLPLAEALGIVLEVLDGLDHAHNVESSVTDPVDGSVRAVRGIVHRDLRPASIYLAGEDGRAIAKVGDFGLAKAFDLAGLGGLSATGAGGTPLYMPRQQILDFGYAEPEVDVWATAATFYRMLTGTTPRTFSRELDPWLVALQSAPVPIRSRDPSIPRPLAKVIDTALIDRPEIPYKTARELRQAIEEAL